MLWGNRAYCAVAESAGIDPSELAGRVEACDGFVDLPTGRFRAEAHRIGEPVGGQRLIELVPLSDRFEAGGDAADRDDLTGCLRRRRFEQCFADWFGHRDERPFALVFLDLDGFKAVNDRLGHLCGDACLGEVGRRIEHAVRGGDLVGRFGGDEFVLLLAGISGPKPFEPIARRLQEAIGQPIETTGGPASLGVSLGAAYSRDGYADPRAMLDAADRAMYASKGPIDPPDDVAESARLG